MAEGLAASSPCNNVLHIAVHRVSLPAQRGRPLECGLIKVGSSEPVATKSLSAEEGKTLLGHPRGLFVLFFAEMWERFSYYGMRALLIFYLVQHWLYSDSEDRKSTRLNSSH